MVVVNQLRELLEVVRILGVVALKANQDLPALGGTHESLSSFRILIDLSVVTACCGCGKPTTLGLGVVRTSGVGAVKAYQDLPALGGTLDRMVGLVTSSTVL